MCSVRSLAVNYKIPVLGSKTREVIYKTQYATHVTSAIDPPSEGQCKLDRTARMTGPDCAVYVQFYKYTGTYTLLPYDRVSFRFVLFSVQ